MKTTKDLYGIDPKEFVDMLYPDVLKLKLEAMEKKNNIAKKEQIHLPYNMEGFLRDSELNQEIKANDRALEYLELWINEIKGLV